MEQCTAVDDVSDGRGHELVGGEGWQGRDQCRQPPVACSTFRLRRLILFGQVLFEFGVR